MIITRAPYRVSFLGGGTDMPAWFREHGGAVLTSSINHYCYLCVRHMPAYLGGKYRLVYQRLENVNSLQEIQHAGIRGCLEFLAVDRGIEINHAGDLPARSGLGSSSSFTVALLQAVHTLEGRYISRDRLAREAIHVEQNVIGEDVGIQDQIECAYGGLNLIEIHKDGAYSVRQVVLSAKRAREFQEHCLLFFTGIQRHSSEINRAQKRNENISRMLMSGIQESVQRGLSALLEAGDLASFGRVLHESWVMKRSLSNLIATPQIDSWYEAALNAGAYGGKLLGAGSGGFLLVFAHPDTHNRVRAALRDLVEAPFSFEQAGAGVVYVSP